MIRPGKGTSQQKVIRDLPLKDASVVRKMPHLQGFELADPLYHKPGPIDILLGQNVFQHLFLEGRVQGPPDTPAAWRTVFGWTVMGLYEETSPAKAITASAHFVDSTQVNQASDKLLYKFWELEEPKNYDKLFTPEELRVEKHYEQTHKYIKERQRYMVSLPKSVSDMQLGESRSQALNRAKANERSLIRKQRWPDFQAVMTEYFELGHARPVSSQDLSLPSSDCYYMPVYSVYKETSSSTKVRAVFDASAPSATGISFNDLLAVGPNIQPSLEQTLLRFRQYPVAISGDIAKMYREILLAPEDIPFHRFMWRKETTEPWVDFEMCRVTFGVTASPYIAVKTLQQAARDFGSSYPRASFHIENSFYVDDFFAGADTPAEAVVLRKEITNVLNQAGFSIKKWRSSSLKVIQAIPSDLLESIPDKKLVDSHSASYPKALGLIWDSRKDEMATHVDLARGYSSTKRGVVSDIAKTFDVLGWLSPVILVMKVLYRNLWERKISWDQQVPEDLRMQHEVWRHELPLLADIRLPRHYFNKKKPATISLHGFSDASKVAFSAVVYVRATYASGSPTAVLVLSKTRVAPLDERSIPELELCGAHLLAKILKTTSQTLEISEENIFAYSDSTIVLSWLDGNPKRYKLYVANRISKTIKLMPPNVWHYVPTHLNPADCASRGISARELISHQLWWNGPPWLQKQPLGLPATPGTSEVEKKEDENHRNKNKELQLCNAYIFDPGTQLESCSNSLVKVLRVTCWVK